MTPKEKQTKYTKGAEGNYTQPNSSYEGHRLLRYDAMLAGSNLESLQRTVRAI